MNKIQYQEIVEFLKRWVKEEGLCRFCEKGRMCHWSRRGREECIGYVFAHEMDCFHLWIAAFDGPVRMREGYKSLNDYPWKNEPPEKDVPLVFPMPQKNETDLMLEVLKRRKYKLMQEIDDIQTGRRLKSLSKELSDVEKSIEQLTRQS